MEENPVIKEVDPPTVSSVGPKLPFYKDKRYLVPALAGGTILIMLIMIGAILIKGNSSSSEADQSISPTPTVEETPSPTPTPEDVSPTPTPKRLITVKPTLTAAPTATPTPPTVTITPVPVTPTPTRAPNPPNITIRYPEEDAYVELTTGQTLCVQDVPNGGDESGLMRKHSINEADWTSYVTAFTLCFDPVEGPNKFQLQYKNSHGEESPVYTRNFHFHRITNN